MNIIYDSLAGGVSRGAFDMVDYTTDSGPVTSGDTTVRVGAGASIGGFTSTAFTWTAGGGQMRIWGSLWGETGISKSGSNGMVLIHAGGSIGGSNVAITGTMSQVYNLGSISGRIDSISASFEMENYGTIVHYNSGSGIATHATGSSVIYNSGSISAWEKAISFGNGQSTLINNGLISRIGSGSGDFAVIEALNSASLNLTNKGTIAGQSQAIRTSDLTAQADTVTNSGSITGNIALNGGNDRYDNTYGMTNGTVDMGDGADTASGGVGTDRINGGAGDDTLTGNDGADTLDGGADNDILNGGTGADRLTGGAGNDTFYVDSNQDRAVEATGGGTDTVYASASYTLRAGQEVETLSADLANDAVGLSLAGNELVQTITGDVGDNRITGGGGADTLIGRGGDDLYVVSDSGTIIVEQASDGYDTVTTTVDFTLADNLDALRVVSSVTDGLSLTGNSGANTITGTTGDDIIDGGGGADMMRGGLGNDTYVLDDAGDIVSDTGGMDTVQASVSYVSIHAVEAIVLTGTANIDATGTSAANDIVGNGGDNSIFGKGGLDTLAGGSGADTFVFGVALNDANFAAIGDFEVDLDRIALDDRYFTRIGGPGGLADAVFTEGPATNTDQRIIYDRVSGTLFYDRDGSGAAVAVAFASVAPETLLSAADFFVI